MYRGGSIIIVAIMNLEGDGGMVLPSIDTRGHRFYQGNGIWVADQARAMVSGRHNGGALSMGRRKLRHDVD